MTHWSGARVPVVGTVLVACLMVFVLTSSPIAATPVLTPSDSTGAWYYGNVVTVSVASQKATDGWMYAGNATFGYTVTVYANSTSSHTLELTVFRTMGLEYSIRFCSPSCSQPRQWANQSLHVYESTIAFANFTDQGTVVLNGSAEVPAIAIQNSTVLFHANVTESSDVYLPLVDKGPHLGYLSANLTGVSSVSFSPALGLFPSQLTPGDTWTSQGAFNETGKAAYSFYFAAHAPKGQLILGPYFGNSSLDAHGSLSVWGAYPVGSDFSYGGSSYPAITLVVVGPFDVREGVIFVPSSVDLFGSASQPWNKEQNGSASAQMATLDLKPSSGDRLDLIASSWQYTSIAANAADSTTNALNTTGIAPAAVSGGNPVSSAKLQGVPESQDQATTDQQCLTSGSGCPLLPNTSTPRNLFGLVLLAGLVATAAVVVSLAVVTRRRQLPPPVYPNAPLYPPGAAISPPASGGTAPPAGPPPPEDDPLSHLW